MWNAEYMADKIATFRGTTQERLAGELSVIFAFRTHSGKKIYLCEGDFAYAEVNPDGFERYDSFPASMVSMLKDCYQGTDCRSGTFHANRNKESLSCNALKKMSELPKIDRSRILTFNIRKAYDEASKELAELCEGFEVSFRVKDAVISIRISNIHNRPLFIPARLVSAFIKRLREEKEFHECQLEAIQDFLYAKANLDPSSHGLLCAYMEAYHCYNTFMFRSLDIEEEHVKPFVDAYIASEPQMKESLDEEHFEGAEKHKQMLYSMMTAYFREWTHLKKDIHPILRKEYAQEIQDEFVQSVGVKGSITMGKTLVISFEMIQAAVRQELTHLVGSASILKVTEGVGLHVVGSAVPLLSNVALGMALSGGLSLFGIIMLSRTIAREVYHWQILTNRNDTLKYLEKNSMAGVALDRDKNVFRIKFEESDPVFCDEYNVSGCATLLPTWKSWKGGCWPHGRKSKGEESHFDIGGHRHEVCQ